MRNIDKALEIIKMTHDGGDLSPRHLKLVEIAVNYSDQLTEFGQNTFNWLHEQVISGTYTPPFLHGIEHVTVDHEGYIYWKGQRVEHFNRPYQMKEDTEFLSKLCQEIERDGKEVNARTYMQYCAKRDYKMN